MHHNFFCACMFWFKAATQGNLREARLGVLACSGARWYAVVDAAAREHIACVRFLNQSLTFGSSHRAFVEASMNNHFSVTRYMLYNEPRIDTNVFHITWEHPFCLDIVRYLVWRYPDYYCRDTGVVQVMKRNGSKTFNTSKTAVGWYLKKLPGLTGIKLVGF